MLDIKPSSFTCAFITLVLSTFTMGQTSPAQAADSQRPQELLHAMIGQKLLMRHFGDTQEAKVKMKDLGKIPFTCDQVIVLQKAEWDKDKIYFAWKRIGSPTIQGKRVGVCRNTMVYGTGTVTITEFSSHETAESIAVALSKILQTPEQYLADASIAFSLPPEPDIAGTPERISSTVTAPKELLTVEAAFSPAQPVGRNFHGTVSVAFYVGTDGRIHRPEILHSPGYGLDQQVLDVVSLWRFEPGRKLDKPVPVTLMIEMAFNTY